MSPSHWLMVVAAGVVSGLVTWLMATRGGALMLDHPTERSLHAVPTPRSGGVGLVAGVAAGLAVALWVVGWSPAPLGWLVVGMALVGVVSLWDDLRPLSPLLRILIHFTAAGALVAGGFALERIELPGVSVHLTPWLGTAVTLVFVVWMVNLYNFMDGMDGFAGGMGLFGFGTLGLLCLWSGLTSLGGVALAIAAANLGFLWFNFPPAKIFMGDLGSSTMGFLAAGIALWMSDLGVTPLWLSLVIFFPFVADATVTVLRRALRGERVWQAHRTHFYQRIVALGWTHRKTVLVEYGLMFLGLFSAIVVNRCSVKCQWTIIAVWMTLTVGLMTAVTIWEMRRSTRE